MKNLSLPQRTHRPGFTLIEILIVIGLMALLASIVLVAVKGVVGNAKIAATKSTINKIDTLLTKRMEAFQRIIVEQDKKAGQGLPPYAAPFSGTGDIRTAKVYGRKSLFRNYFYQPLDWIQREANGKSENTAIDFVEAKLRADLSDPNARGSFNNKASMADSSECLYFMLTKDVSAGMEAADADLFGASELGDTDGDGLLEFLDGWGEPLRFYRWPTRLVRPELSSGSEAGFQTVDTKNPSDPHDLWEYGRRIQPEYSTALGARLSVLISTYQTGAVGPTFGHEHSDPLARDPDDPLGKLHPTDRDTASNAASNFERDFHTLDTAHTPLIVSSGPDKQFGIWAPLVNPTTNIDENKNRMGRLAQPDLSNLEAILDNITNRNVRAGGN